MKQRLEYFLIGVITGIVVGAVAGLLLAPASGVATRRRLADEARRAADVARDVAVRAEHAAEVIGGRVDHYLGRDEELAWRKVEEIRAGMKRYTQAQTHE